MSTIFGDFIISLYPPSVFSYFNNNGVFQGAGGRIKYSNLICSEIVCIDVILQVSAKVEGGGAKNLAYVFHEGP